MKADGQGSDHGFVLLGDQPHAGRQDPLGFDAIVEELASLILSSRASTPFTLGIEAAWGRGKSTLMARLCSRLEAEGEDVKPVLFNAWTADNGAVLEGLVKTVLNELDPSVLRRALRDRKLMSALRLGLSVIGGLVGFGNVVDTVWDRVAADPRARNDLRKLVEDAVNAWSNEQSTSGRLLCVFVDDLDRCSPRGVLGVFEAMKLYLDVPGIVFVVGYDQEIVSELVLRRKGYSEAIKSRDYLEKFIQIVYRMPRADSDQSGALVASLLESSRTAGLFGPTEREIVIDGSESNPRRIKRFINSFVLAYGLDARWRKFQPEGLVRIQLLQMYFPEFARMLERPANPDAIEEFFDYLKARDALRRQETDGWPHVVRVLSGYGLASPASPEAADFDVLLGRLEDNVPVAFAPLSGRADFTSLAKSVADGADWPELRTALAEGTLPPIARDQSEAAGAAQGSQGGRRLEGLRVLWIDDEPGSNRRVAEMLEESGVDLTLVSSTSELTAMLTRRAFDVLISDIDRGGDPDAGLDAVDRLRAQGVPVPPTIYFALRLTQSRLNRVMSRGSLATTDPIELLELLEQERLRAGEEASQLQGPAS